MVPEQALGLRAADWIGLAAAPTFGVLALVSLGSGTDVLCASETSPLGGMAMMYLLMSAVHLAPWLKLMSRRRRISRESYP